jgi:colanic acid biosynthesis glycosyl transferase WcaI
MKRIWVLTELYYPEQTSTGYLLTKTAEGLANRFDVKVITGPATRFLQREPRSKRHETVNGVDIIRCGGTNLDKNSLPKRMVNLVTRSLAIGGQALTRVKRDDLVFVVTNPPSLPFVALILRWIKGARYVLLIHDVYPEVLVATRLAKPGSAIVKIGAWLNRILYNGATRVVTLGRDMTTLAEQKLEDVSVIRCIPNWAENEIVWPTARAENALLRELDLLDKFVVLYAGNIGKTHGMEVLVEAAKLMAGSDVHFVVLGFGAKRAWLEEKIAEFSLTNITLVAPKPRSEQLMFLNACDVALISFVEGMAGVSVPSRMYSQMAAGKPIVGVADEYSELARVISEERIGWVVKPGDVDGLIDSITQLRADPEMRHQMGKRAADAAKSKYTLAEADRRYSDLFEELT